MGREQILSRLKKPSWAKSALPPQFTQIRKPEAGDADAFTANAQAASAEVMRVSDMEAARLYLGDLLQKEGVANVIAADDPATQGLRLEALAGERGFFCANAAHLQGQAYLDAVYAAGMGISGCSWALAETGAIVLAHRHGSERLISHAPDHYVGIVFKEQILKDRFSLAPLLQEDVTPPAAWTLITGVSRTADVALQVILGMHGPRRVSIILIG